MFTSTTEVSGVWHTDSGASTAGGGEVGGDNMRLRDGEGSGAWETGRGVLQGERESLEERGRSTSTASEGSSCSMTTEMDGSERTGVGVLSSGTAAVFSCMETAGCAGLFSGRVSSERTSLAGEKQRETFLFLFRDA